MPKTNILVVWTQFASQNRACATFRIQQGLWGLKKNLLGLSLQLLMNYLEIRDVGVLMGGTTESNRKASETIPG